MLYTGSKNSDKVNLTPLPPQIRVFHYVSGINICNLAVDYIMHRFLLQKPLSVQQISSQNHSPSTTGDAMQVKWNYKQGYM
jgi:hypothetical protein